jgi:hypothetical protein
MLGAEVAGLVAAAAVLRALVPGGGPLRLGVPTAVALVLIAFAVPSVWGAMRGLDAGRDQLVLAPGINEREKCFVDGHEDWAVNFMRWVAQRVPEHARFAYLGTGDPVCVQLVMLPRLLAESGQKAQFTVYANAVPEAVRAKLRAERRLPPASRTVQRYGDGLLVVREP